MTYRVSESHKMEIRQLWNRNTKYVANMAQLEPISGTGGGAVDYLMFESKRIEKN